MDTMTDGQVIEALGGAAQVAVELHLSVEIARKFSKRGIPWKYRVSVWRLAKAKKVKLPDDFLETQRAA